MIACSCGKAHVMQYLLDPWASILKEDEFGFKAIDYINENLSSLHQRVGQHGNETAVHTFDRTEDIIGSFNKGVLSLHIGLEQLPNASP